MCVEMELRAKLHVITFKVFDVTTTICLQTRLDRDREGLFCSQWSAMHSWHAALSLVNQIILCYVK